MAFKNIKDFETKLLEIARNRQQDYYELLIDFTQYEPNQYRYLKSNIGYALFGYPYPEDDNQENKNQHCQHEETGVYTWPEKKQKIIDMIHKKVIKYGKWEGSRDVILCGVIYNVVFNAKQALENWQKNNQLPNKQRMDEPELQVYPIPVFKVRQYINTTTRAKYQSTERIARTYFIDNSGRVYDTFNEYLVSNTLHKCTMVLPKQGRYQIDPKFQYSSDFTDLNEEEIVTPVWLEIRESPAYSLKKKIANRTDIVSTVAGVAGMGIGIAAMFTPLGPALVATATICGGASGLWGAGRSAYNLADRGMHDESLTDRDAAGSWIGIAGGVAGAAASGSTALIGRAIRTGTNVSRAAAITFNTLVVGNCVINGVGIGFQSYNIYMNYQETNEIDLLNVALLGAHVFFFCNTVMNVRFAKTMIKSTQGQLLKDYEQSLRSNRHRRAFRSMVRNTGGTDDISRNAEIIRGINTINNKDEFFQAMVRNRKVFSTSNVKPSFQGGEVTITSKLTIDPIEFSNLPKDTRTQILNDLFSKDTGGVAPLNTAGTDENVGAATSTKPGASTGSKIQNPSKLETSTGTKTQNPNKLGTSTGSKMQNPETSTGSKTQNPETSTGSKTLKSSPTGTKPKTSTGSNAQNTNKPETSTAKKTEIPNKPETSTGKKTQNLNKPETSSGSKKDNSSKPKSNDPKTVPSTEINSGSTMSLGGHLNTCPPQNSSSHYGTVLQSFCTLHKIGEVTISFFVKVLNEIDTIVKGINLQNEVFLKCLKIAYQITLKYIRGLSIKREIAVGDLLSYAVEFVWDFARMNLPRPQVGHRLTEDPEVGKMIDGILGKIADLTLIEIDKYVQAFKKWLQDRFLRK